MTTALDAFHFLRPWWFLALVPLAVLAWYGARRAPGASPWRAACDAELLRALQGPLARVGPWPLRLLLLGAALGVTALAGPAWQRLPTPLFTTSEARVLVLDLSASMDAADVRPSRLARARFAASDLLDSLPEGRFAIVVFAGTAFTVIPLTDDREAARHLLQSLTTDLMPVPGGHVAEGISEGARLLASAGAIGGDLIVMTDSEVDDAALAAARAAAAAGHQLAVIGIGTHTGAPIPRADGGFVRDARGAIVLPGLDEVALQNLAAAGQGRYQRLGDGKLSADAFAWLPQAADGTLQDARLQTDLWRDEGRWLVLLLLPLAALAFRRGWVAALVLALPLAPVETAHAFEWSDLWLRADQQGQQLLQDGAAAAAARKFEDPRWRGAAAYRSGDFGGAMRDFATADDGDAHYNRGNALARAGRLREAVGAYDAALQRAPRMEDARFNRALVEQLLKEQQQSDDQGDGDTPQQSSSGSGAQPQAGADAAGQASAQQQGGAPQGQGRQSGQDSAGTGATGSERTPAPGQQAGTAAAAGDAAQGREQAGSAGAEAAAGKAERGAQPQPGGEAGQQTAAAEGEPTAPGEGTQQDAPFDATPVAREQWLRRVQPDPGGLLRRKFLRQQERRAEEPIVDQPW